MWLETGTEEKVLRTDPATRTTVTVVEPRIQLINGAAEGILSWVEKEFGPLTEIDEQFRSSRSGASP
jgi:hypothetical protein